MQEILIVDDTLQDLKTGIKLLSNAGYLVYTARSGEDAFSILEKRVPDVLLLDLIMPGMDGIEMIKRIKSNFSGIPVVLCTAAGQESVVRLAMLSGAAGVIIKPYDPETMLRTIRRALGEDG